VVSKEGSPTSSVNTSKADSILLTI